MTTFFIILLTISQSICFFFLFKNKRVIKEEKDNPLTLKPIPKQIGFEDVQPNYKLLYNVLETIKFYKINKDLIGDKSYLYDINIYSNYGLSISSRIRTHGDVPSLSWFRIAKESTPTTTLTFNNTDSVKNDIIIFVWDYIIKYHESLNDDDIDKYSNTIDIISNELKTLKRNERLDKILNYE
jgi:hypothetical protein